MFIGVFGITVRQWGAKKKYYHTEFIYDGFAYSSISNEGVRKTAIESLSKDEFTIKKVKKVDIKYALTYFENREHFKYDWLAIFFTQIFNFNIESKEASFCADLNAGMLGFKNSHRVGVVQLMDLIEYHNKIVK